MGKVFQRLFNGQAEDIGNRLAIKFVFQHFIFKTFSLADLTRGFGFIQKGETDINDSQTLTIFTCALRVEAKEGITNVVGFGEVFADFIHDSGIGCRS